MVRDFYYNIADGLETKKNLLSLKELLKDKVKGSRERDALLLILKGDYSVFTGLLKDEDPKIRKNSAIILGELGAKECLDAVYEAYTSDTIMYNKAAYLEAICKIDYKPYLAELKERFEELKKTPIIADNKRHILDEMNRFKKIFGTDKPVFIGYNLNNEVILTTNRDHKDVTKNALAGFEHREFAAGFIIKTDKIRQILPIRTFDEILFIPDKVKSVSSDPVKAAKELVDGGISDYIRQRIGYEGEKRSDQSLRVNFRTQLKTKDKELAADFAKKFSSELETATAWELSNSVSDYDIEFRFVENSKGSLNVLIKFWILKDVRFTYRKETIASCIKPYTAATLMQLAKPNMRPNAVVLDPFCGVGTMIAEREAVVNAKMYYGIDIFGEAIEKASKNLKSAGLMKKTELIKKDFFDFEHEYKFDEIITDMPFETDKKSEKDIENIYKRFFEKSDGLLEKEALIVLYSRNPEFVHKYHAASGCAILKDFEISKRENSHLFVLAR